MVNGLYGIPRNGNQELLSLHRGTDIGFTIAARYGDTGLTIPVPTMKPTEPNSSFALDLAPSGPNPVEFPGNGYCWLDVCDADVQDSNFSNGVAIPVNCARVAMTSTGAQFGHAPFNGAPSKPIEFIQGAATPVARMNATGFQMGSATRTPQARIEATDDTIVNFMNVYSGEGVAGTLTNHPYSIWTNNVKRAVFNTSGDLNGLSSITRTGGVAIQGKNTNTLSSAGMVGEIVESTRVAGSAIALTIATPLNVVSISLTAGDWDVSGQAYLNLAGTTSYENFQYSITTTSATADVNPGRWNNFKTIATVPGGTNLTWGSLTRRLQLASTTTVYLMAQATFTVSTAGAWGIITARRAA